ncbi:phage tail assembly chaperone [Achromobacter xylosoxidans]|uniref:phage tail assembly chaperone n=1 Tax=Alcaligenes xylosoxydans xylosoxydans TaxID=85698 RepID=UPI00244C8EAC|nr:phage tail assembly chaperone [Achromobacter xylosoxidans]MDH0519983.1 phage tail assembly chaperone [Achromobacter xylosoxidans]MDH0543879.1 phage tail assembly chaperone [Achromobacter xylosoxidans]
MPKHNEDQLFSLTPPATFAATVDIPRPGTEPAKLRLTFRHKTKEDLNAWLASGTDVESDAEWLGVIVAGWEGVSTDFSPQALALLVSNYHRPAVEAIVDKYLSELTEFRRGN